MARKNAVRLRETAEDAVNSWEFFRQYYLNHESAHWFDKYVEPAPGHAEWVHACALHPRVVIAAHRGSAKSTIFSGEFTLLDLVAAPYSRTLLVLSTKDKVERRLGDLMMQIQHNERIIEDFGALKPMRGEGHWNHKMLKLKNGAELVGLSVGSKSLRGERPHRIIVDDPEFDPKEGTNIDKLIRDMDLTLFQVLIPMLRKGSCLHWIGTPIRRRLFLWRVITNELGDPRIDPSLWFRKIYPGCKPDLSDPFWPAENPPDELARKRQEFGSGWGAEFLCCPGSSEEAPLIIDTALNTYQLESGDDPRLSETPLESMSRMTWHDCKVNERGELEKTLRGEEAGRLFGGMLRFITVDPIRVPGPHSDFAVIHTLGIDKLGQRFSLDLWIGKARYAQLTRKLWEYVEKWRTRVVGVEAVSMEREMLAQVMESAPRFAEQFGWVPQIVPITYPSGVGKADRIQALEFFFKRGQVKLPSHLRFSEPYNTLFSQVEMFTPNLANLEHDDAVDTLAMSLELTKGRRGLRDRVEPLRTISEVLKSGDRYLEGNIPVALALDLETVSISDIVAWIDKQQLVAEQGSGERRKLNWQGASSL